MITILEFRNEFHEIKINRPRLASGFGFGCLGFDGCFVVKLSDSISFWARRRVGIYNRGIFNIRESFSSDRSG